MAKYIRMSPPLDAIQFKDNAPEVIQFARDFGFGASHQLPVPDRELVSGGTIIGFEETVVVVYREGDKVEMLPIGVGDWLAVHSDSNYPQRYSNKRFNENFQPLGV